MITTIMLFTSLNQTTQFIILGVFSLIIGSFLNVVIYRLPLMLRMQWQTHPDNSLDNNIQCRPSLNLFLPRSHCPHCHQLIPAWHNIPLLSYIFLRGRCHHCDNPISKRYPVVEGLCLSLSLLAAFCLGFHLTLCFALPFIWLLLCLSFIDLEHQILPDCLTLSLLWLGLLANTLSLFTTLDNAVLSTVGAYLSLWTFAKLFQLFTGKIGMGNGDFKLFAAFGAWFGWTALPIILFIASVIGTVVGFIYLKQSGKNRDTPISFGPFLCISAIIVLLTPDHLPSLL